MNGKVNIHVAKHNNLKCEIYPFDKEWNDVGSINVYQELNNANVPEH